MDPEGGGVDGNAAGDFSPDAAMEQRTALRAGLMEESASATGNSVATINLDASSGMQQTACSTGSQMIEAQARRSKISMLKEPKIRSADLIQRDKEREHKYQAASERSLWPPQHAPQERSGWQANHQILFLNHNLHPNARSYFDRFRLRTSESSDETEPAQPPLKPSWKLDAKAPHPEEREAKRQLVKQTGPNASPLIGTAPEVLQHGGDFAPPAQPLGSHISEQDEQDRSPPDPDGEEPVEAQPGTADMDELGQSQSWQSQNQHHWDDRHYVTWCNERHTSGKKLNPVQLRSYFDRMRFPHNSRCEVEIKPPLARTLPEWRLRLDPLTGKDVGRLTDGSLESGGSKISSAVDILKAPSREPDLTQSSEHSKARESRWSTRHELVFKNEEVSRLDRCYFDRWKEPEANLHKERVVRSLKPTWSLERDGSPDATAEELMRSSAYRHSKHGNWNSRHELLFYNKIHPGARSYFGRKRETEDMAAPRQRKKVQDKEKLKADWNSLQDYSGVDFNSSLRAASAPALPTSKGRSTMMSVKPTSASSCPQKKRPDWFSSHGIIF